MILELRDLWYEEYLKDYCLRILEKRRITGDQIEVFNDNEWV